MAWEQVKKGPLTLNSEMLRALARGGFVPKRFKQLIDKAWLIYDGQNVSDEKWTGVFTGALPHPVWLRTEDWTDWDGTELGLIQDAFKQGHRVFRVEVIRKNMQWEGISHWEGATALYDGPWIGARTWEITPDTEGLCLSCYERSVNCQCET